MKALKIAGFVLGGYVLLVIAFESMIGILQPQEGSVLTITTKDANGDASDRVLAALESDGKLYVSANHWPRAWYNEALANPEVEVTLEGRQASYTAVPIPADGADHERLDAEHAHPFLFRFITGFPPRYFLRLDPRQADAARRSFAG